MYKEAKDVAVLDDHRLLLTFADGEQRVLDMQPYLDHGIFAELRDERLFRTAHIGFDTVEWANGADLCPEVLYSESTPVRKVAEDRAPYGSGPA